MSKKKQHATPNQLKPGTRVANNIEYRGEYQFRVSIRRRGHPEIHKTFETLAEAVDFRDTILAKIKLGGLVDTRRADQMSFGDLACDYLKNVTPTKKGADSESYRIRRIVGYTVMPDETVQVGVTANEGKIVPPQRIATYKLSICDDEVAREWVADREAEGWSEANIDRYRNVLAAIFSWGRTVRKFPIANPFAGLPQSTVDNSRSRRISLQEELALVDALEHLTYKMDSRSGQPIFDADGRPYLRRRPSTSLTRRRSAFFRLALETACRTGELLRTVWYDDEGNEVNLEEGYIFLLGSKNGDNRTVGLSDEAIAILSQIRGSGSVESGQSVFGFSADAWKSAWRRALTAARLQYNEKCALLGQVPDPKFLSDLHFHDTRHEGATQLAKVMDKIDLMKQGGWRDARSLARYFNPSGEEMRAKVANFRRQPAAHKTQKGSAAATILQAPLVK